MAAQRPASITSVSITLISISVKPTPKHCAFVLRSTPLCQTKSRSHPVSRILCLCDHLSGKPVARLLVRHNGTRQRSAWGVRAEGLKPCSPALLPMGFTRRICLQTPGALLPHHFALTMWVRPAISCLFSGGCARRHGGMFLWHFPSGRPARPLAGIAAPRSPDFPLHTLGRTRSGHPDDFDPEYGTCTAILVFPLFCR